MQIAEIAEYTNPNRWEQSLTLEQITDVNSVYYRLAGACFGKDYKTLRGAKAALTRNGFALYKTYESEE